MKYHDRTEYVDDDEMSEIVDKDIITELNRGESLAMKWAELRERLYGDVDIAKEN